MLECWQQHQTSLSQGNWPCEIIHFTFHEVCSGADLLTLLDLLDHVREGYFSAVFLLPPDDSAGQQPTRTRSQPLGLDGLCPKATRIVRGTNQHTELTARFAKRALLCSVHKVATVLIIPEDIGGHPATGPPSLWSMSELQTLEGLGGAHRGAGFSCQLGNAEQGLATVLSNLSSVSLLLHRGWPQPQQVHDGVSDLLHRGPLPKTCPCTAQHNLNEVVENWQEPSSVRSQSWQRFLSEVFRRLRISTLPQDGEQSLVSYRVFVTAVYPLPFLFFWHRLSSFSSGPLGAQAPRARCTAHFTRVTSCLTSSSIFRLHLQLQPWRKALLWLHVARFPSGSLQHLFHRVCRSFHFSQKVRESFALSRLRKLDGGRPSWIVRKSAALVRLRKLDGNPLSSLVTESVALVRLSSLDPSVSSASSWRGVSEL